MSILTDLVARLAVMEAKLHTLTNQVSPLQMALVTDNDDPAGQRRIRVSREVQGGANSYWVQAGRSQTHTDEPLPQIGSTVLIGAVDGNPHDLYLIRTLTNDTNPADTRQKDPIKDHTTEVQGDLYLGVTGDRAHKVDGQETQEIGGNLSIKVSGGLLKVRSELGRVEISAMDTVILKNDAGASLTLLMNGSIVFQDNAGRKIYLGGLSDPQAYWDLNGTSINMINAANFTINGVSVAGVGAVDSRGDALVTRGWV